MIDWEIVLKITSLIFTFIVTLPIIYIVMCIEDKRKTYQAVNNIMKGFLYMKLPNCKYCGSQPIKVKKNKVYIAKCTKCGYSVKHLEETAMVHIERVKLEKIWIIDQYMPKTTIKRYF